MSSYKEKNDELIREYLKTKSKESFDDLVMNNQKLIYFALKTMNIPLKYYDIYFDAGLISLMEAIKGYDEKYLGKCSFSGYALKCIKCKFYKVFKSERNYYRLSKISLDESIDNASDVNVYNLVSYELWYNCCCWRKRFYRCKRNFHPRNRYCICSVFYPYFHGDDGNFQNFCNVHKMRRFRKKN